MSKQNFQKNVLFWVYGPDTTCVAICQSPRKVFGERILGHPWLMWDQCIKTRISLQHEWYHRSIPIQFENLKIWVKVLSSPQRMLQSIFAVFPFLEIGNEREIQHQENRLAAILTSNRLDRIWYCIQKIYSWNSVADVNIGKFLPHLHSSMFQILFLI